MSTAWWLLGLVVSAIVGHVYRSRGLRAAILLVSGALMVAGFIVTIAIIAYAVDRHSRRDGSDILFIVATFTAIATFVSWVVFVVARKVGEATGAGRPEAIIPTIPARRSGTD